MSKKQPFFLKIYTLTVWDYAHTIKKQITTICDKWYYNHQPLKFLNYKNPFSAILEKFDTMPIIKYNPHHYIGGIETK